MICMTSREVIEIVVAGDQPIMLAAVGKALRDDGAFHVVAECKDGAEALDSIRKHRPALALLDFSIRRLNAVKVLAAVNQNELPTKIVFFGTLPTGAYGILTKDVSSSELVLSLKSVARAEKLPLSTAVTSTVEREALRIKRAEFVDKSLTAREKEIMLLAAAALSNKEISAKLSLSNGTVKLHLHNVYQKLGISSRLALVELANDYSKELTGER
jgi:two-component system nitrate/nitrite response regulator NarL